MEKRIASSRGLNSAKFHFFRMARPSSNEPMVMTTPRKAEF